MDPPVTLPCVASDSWVGKIIYVSENLTAPPDFSLLYQDSSSADKVRIDEIKTDEVITNEIMKDKSSDGMILEKNQ